MPGSDQKPPRVAADERTTVLALLQYQRDSFVRKVSGVSDADARRPLVGSGTTLLWLAKHLAQAESTWLVYRFAGDDNGIVDDTVRNGDTLEGALAAYRAMWGKVDGIVAAADLDDHCRRADRRAARQPALGVDAPARGDGAARGARRHLAGTDRRPDRTLGEDEIVDWKLELIILPVSDVDRAKDFYTKQVGFNLDVDHQVGDDFRVVQMTPPGSACSITIGKGVGDGVPGSYGGMHLVVNDIDAACAQLAENGVEVGEMHHFTENGRTAGLHPDRSDYETFSSFNDPDGNTWVIQEVGHA